LPEIILAGNICGSLGRTFNASMQQLAGQAPVIESLLDKIGSTKHSMS